MANTANYSEPVKFSVTNTYGNHPSGEDDVYTVQEFLSCVEHGGFVDYDGFGHPVKDSLSDWSVDIKPSRQGADIPEDTTHIVWHNK